MFVSGKYPVKLVKTMNTEMTCDWGLAQKQQTVVSLKKAHFIIFCKIKRGYITSQNDLIVDDVVINRTKRTRFLGVMVDQYLTFEAFVKYIVER